MKNRSAVVSVILAACLTLPPAQAVEPGDPRNGRPGTAGECAAFHLAVDLHSDIPNIEQWWMYPSMLQGNTLKVHINTQQRDYVYKAFDMWNEATDNLINFEVVPQDAEDVVSIYDVAPGELPQALGVFSFETFNIGLNLNYTTDVKSKIGVIAHELGHAMGLGHTCTGDLMVGYGKSDFVVSRYDAELLRQSVNAGHYSEQV